MINDEQISDEFLEQNENNNDEELSDDIYLESIDIDEDIDIKDNDSNIYFNEIGKLPLLTDQEFKDLYYDYKNNGNIEAKNAIIEHNLRLVVSIAKRYTSDIFRLQEFVSCGNIGIIEALERFDITKGCKFSTYACPWIIRYINDYIYSSSRNLHFPRHVSILLNKINSYEQSYLAKFGCKPTEKEIAEAVGINEDQLAQLRLVNYNFFSLNQVVFDDDGDTTYVDCVSDDKNDIEEHVMKNELSSVIREVLSEFSYRERLVISLRFGLDDGIVRTLEEVGSVMNITRERVRQIESKALERLSHNRKIKSLRY